MRGPHVADASRSPHAVLQPVPLGAVELEGGLWGGRWELAARVAIRQQHRALEEWGTLENFRRAAAGAALPAQPTEWADSDLYKWIEAASWLLASRDDPWIREQVEAAVALIEAAQGPDGYVDTFYAGRPSERWSDLRRRHELYCLGHLLQAAVAHRRATGGARLLAVARRAADLVCATFGPGRRQELDGHPGIEVALIELYRETDEPRYLDTARHFLEARGRGRLPGGRLGPAYYVDHAPLRELEQVAGHAVRALYYLAGATDLCLEAGDATLLRALDRLWTRMVQRQVYVSGGLGARRETESFGDDLELPGRRACSETCAAVASVLWSQRMLMATGDPRHADLVEWTLFNAVLPGWSLDGGAYFYENPLEDDGRHRRQPWFECACCPPNLLRLVAVMPALLYGLGPDTVHVHHYASSRARLEVAGRTVEIRQRTRYPWDGEVELEVDGDGEGDLGLALRIPAWCRTGASLTVNGAPVQAPLVPGTSVELRRTWSRGDRVALSLPMPVRPLRAHPRLRDAAGRVALTRGPLLYCLEGVDHPGVNLEDVELDPAQAIEQAWRPELLGGVVALRAAGMERTPGPGWEERLYAPASEVPAGTARRCALVAIPYQAWANRAAGPLQVWVRAAG